MIEHPESQNVTLFEGTIHLSCTATGFPSPEIFWFHNDTLEVGNMSSSEAINAYTTRSTIMTSNPSRNDSGAYYCGAFVEGYDDFNSNTVLVLVQGRFCNMHENFSGFTFKS